MKKLLSLISFLLVVIIISSTSFAEANVDYEKANVGIVVRGEMVSQWSVEPVTYSGRIYIEASAIDKLGASVTQINNSDVTILKDGNLISFSVGKPVVTINGMVNNLDASPILIGNTVMIPVRHVAEAMKLSVLWDQRSSSVLVDTDSSYLDLHKNGFRVVIDPGHGGSETGAFIGRLYEKNINYDVSSRVYSMLKQQGVDVYITRTGDYTVGLYERSKMANELNADLFVSIHNNAMPGKSGVNGSMVLYYPDNKIVNGLTGENIASTMVKNLSLALNTKNLGIVSRPGLAVLRTTNMPAVLVELGFMTNPNELSRIISESFRIKAAQTITQSIINVMNNR